MGLTLNVGVLSSERSADFARRLEGLNEVLRSAGLPEHEEPRPARFWNYSLPSYGLQALRRVAAYVQLEKALPRTEGDEDADSDPVLSGQLRVALRLLEQAGGFRPWSNARFSDRSREEREAILAAWERSRIGPLRQVAAALRKVAMFSYYSRPASWPETGYDGPRVGR